MFLLKLLLKLVVFPLLLIVFFLRIWVDMLYKIGEMAFGLFCLVMLAVFATNVWVIFKWQMYQNSMNIPPFIEDIGILIMVRQG